MTEWNLNCPDCRGSTAPCGRHGSFVITPHVPAMPDPVSVNSAAIVQLEPCRICRIVDAVGQRLPDVFGLDGSEPWLCRAHFIEALRLGILKIEVPND